MASLIIAASVLTFDKIQSTRAKRRARKASRVADFPEMEKANVERMVRLHPETAAQFQTPRTSADPFRDSVESGGEVGVPIHGGRTSSEVVEPSEGPPPEYESLVRGDRGKRNSRILFWRRGSKGGSGEGVVR